MRRLLWAALLVGCAHGGSRAEVRFERRHLFISEVQNATVGDLDRDGHLDIVYGGYWFAGPGFVPRAFREPIETKALRTNSSHILDVDGDGWPDIITGGWSEEGIW